MSEQEKQRLGRRRNVSFNQSEFYKSLPPKSPLTRSDPTMHGDETVVLPNHAMAQASQTGRLQRRSSMEVRGSEPRHFLIHNVQQTQEQLLAQEDTNGDAQITVEDAGPKCMRLGTLQSGGLRRVDIRGTYRISSLLQELALAEEMGHRSMVLEESLLIENPVERLSRLIRDRFWPALVRRIDANGLEIICNDPKSHTEMTNGLKLLRIYVPFEDSVALDYFIRLASTATRFRLEVIRLPKEMTPEYVKSLNEHPGILALAMRPTGSTSPHILDQWQPVPFVVPGGRFNELYGWDSYFESLGLIEDGRVDLARDMVDHFIYEIHHYGKILNANRSYYLNRSQPPFLTDMAWRVFVAMEQWDMAVYLYDEEPKISVLPAERRRLWLARALKAAIKEYEQVWMSEPRYVASLGLSRYYGIGIGLPPETEPHHFNVILAACAERHGLDLQTFATLYANGTLKDAILDSYCIHDRAVRESGHDTTYRLEGRCAALCTVDLNALLHRYELDLGRMSRDLFQGQISVGDKVYTSDDWFKAAEKRRQRMTELMWNEEQGLFFDYDIEHHCQSHYESVTTLYSLWSGVASLQQAERQLESMRQKFEMPGGLVSGTEASRGELGLTRPSRQWDYPYGWAPHQILAWHGLIRYGYTNEAQRLIYRWLWMLTRAFVDFNGVVPEKFDVVHCTHRVQAEYGNVGTDFKCRPKEGFGWMNASYQVGLSYLKAAQRRALATLTPVERAFKKLEQEQSIMDPELSALHLRNA